MPSNETRRSSRAAVAPSRFQGMSPFVRRALSDSGVLPHLSQTDASGFSANFDMIEAMEGTSRCRGPFGRLSALENKPGPVSQDFLVEMMLTSAELRKGSTYVDMFSGQIVESGKSVGRLYYWRILDHENGSAADVIAGLRAMPTCRPFLVDGRPFPA